MDTRLAYPLAFGYIRQLALLLRQALTAKTKESYRAVYCWQVREGGPLPLPLCTCVAFHSPAALLLKP